MQRTIMITGATSGLGYAMADALAGRYALILTARQVEKGRQVLHELRSRHPETVIDLVSLDLASFVSIDACVRKLEAGYSQIDVLFNNAGLFMDHQQKTAEGFEMTLGVNHVGPAYLTWRLLPLIRQGNESQIIQMCSRAALAGRYRDRPDLFENHPHGFRAYAASKLMQLRMTQYWSTEFAAEGITVNAVHPGVVATGIWRGDSWLMRYLASKSNRYLAADEAARSGLYLIEQPAMRRVSGRFFEKDGCEIRLRAALRDPARAGSLAGLTRSAILAKGGILP